MDEVKYCEDTRPGHQLEASKKQHEVLCKRLKSKKVILHTVLPGVGGSVCTSHTLNHLKELGLDVQKSNKTALKQHAHSVLYAHKLKTTRCALENPVALKVLVWSRGRLVTLQILTSSSFSLVVSRLFGPMCLLFLNRCREWFHCLRSFSFSFYG